MPLYIYIYILYKGIYIYIYIYKGIYIYICPYIYIYIYIYICPYIIYIYIYIYIYALIVRKKPASDLKMKIYNESLSRGKNYILEKKANLAILIGKNQKTCNWLVKRKKHR